MINDVGAHEFINMLIIFLQLPLFAIAFSPAAQHSRRRSSAALSPFSFQRRRICAVSPLAASTLAYKEADGSMQTKPPPVSSQLEDGKLEGGGGGGDDDAVNVVLVTGFESFNRDLYEEAGRMLPKECEINLKGVFHCLFSCCFLACINSACSSFLLLFISPLTALPCLSIHSLLLN